MQNDRWESLGFVIRSLRGGAIAVSGGVDSMTLAAFARSVLGADGIRMIHAISPAVPLQATERVRAHAARGGWRLTELNAGEFDDPRYRANPVNRCFFCKSNLYEALGRVCDGVIISGTNCDDLGDYRPGLQAAANNGVRHPYVEANMDKVAVRAMARDMRLDDLSELPASPCLSSRVETGIPIESAQLKLIDQIETWLRGALSAETVRCRIRRQGMVIELDAAALEALSDDQRRTITEGVRAHMPDQAGMCVDLMAYERGSAFVGAPATSAT